MFIFYSLHCAQSWVQSIQGFRPFPEAKRYNHLKNSSKHILLELTCIIVKKKLFCKNWFGDMQFLYQEGTRQNFILEYNIIIVISLVTVTSSTSQNYGSVFKDLTHVLCRDIQNTFEDYTWLEMITYKS